MHVILVAIFANFTGQLPKLGEARVAASSAQTSSKELTSLSKDYSLPTHLAPLRLLNRIEIIVSLAKER